MFIPEKKVLISHKLIFKKHLCIGGVIVCFSKILSIYVGSYVSSNRYIYIRYKIILDFENDDRDLIISYQ